MAGPDARRRARLQKGGDLDRRQLRGQLALDLAGKMRAGDGRLPRPLPRGMDTEIACLATEPQRADCIQQS